MKFTADKLEQAIIELFKADQPDTVLSALSRVLKARLGYEC